MKELRNYRISGLWRHPVCILKKYKLELGKFIRFINVEFIFMPIGFKLG